MTTFLVSGLWHGASWNFILWGGLHGSAQIFTKSHNKLIYSTLPPSYHTTINNPCNKFVTIEQSHNSINKWKTTLKNIINIIISFLTVTIAWIFFRHTDISQALMAVKKIVTKPGMPFIDYSALAMALIPLAILIFKEFKDEANWDFGLMHSKSTVVSALSTGLVIVFILIFANFDNSSFIYFQF